MRNRTVLTAIAAGLALSLSACGSGPGSGDESAAEPSNATLTAMIAKQDDLSTLSALMAETGLMHAFDTQAPYTIFAPNDAAFAALGEEFAGNDARAAQVALMRNHIVPGYLSLADIAAATAQKGGPVEMQSMGATPLIFSSDGDKVTVQSGAGEPRDLPAEPYLAANGVIYPIEAVLGETAD